MQIYGKNIYKLYLVVFFHNLIPAYVIERLFWQERGMNIQMVVYCEIIYAATIVAMEVPSGILADRFGRKNLLIVGSLMACIEFLLLIFANTFWHFGLVVFLAGIGKSATSGTWNSLLYESLAETGEQGRFEKVVGRMQALDYTAAGIAALSGSALAHWFGYITNYGISFVSTLVALAATLLLKDPYVRRPGGKKAQGSVEIVRVAAVFFKKSPGALMVVLHGAVIAACVNYVDEFWQLYLDGLGVPVLFFGLLSLVLMAVRIPGALTAGWLLERFRPTQILGAISWLVGLGILTSALVKSRVGIVFLAVALLALSIMDPVIDGYLHHRADAQARATIESMGSLFERAMSIGIGLVFAYIAEEVTLYAGFGAIAVMCILMSVCYSGIYGKWAWWEAKESLGK